ncbi:MAG: hypothetical protein NTW87_07290 [Planctomycetota bacterium]|nr:hypothetical protein [Planctomycetota bacterium]
MGFLVQDRRLLPERSFDDDGPNHRVLMLEQRGELLGGVRANRLFLVGHPRCQRADFQFDLRLDGIQWKGPRIPNEDVLALGQNFNVRPKTGLQILAQDRRKSLRQELRGPSVGVLAEGVLLRRAAVLPRFAFGIPEQPPVQNQINVLREALDGPKCLGEAGPALEGHASLPWTVLKKVIENPADPEVLLDDGLVHALGLCRGPEQFCSVFLRALGRFTHCVLPPPGA